MDINESLLEKTWQDITVEGWNGVPWTTRTDLLSEYGCWRNEIERFLACRTSFLERQQEAVQIIKNIMTFHGKGELLKYVAELARVEYRIRELEPWVRDHVVHALLTFLLGIYLNEKFLKPAATVDIFQWKLAGLLHDVAYPVQIAKDILKPFGTKINEIKRELGSTAPDIHSRIHLDGLDRLSNGVCSFDLIQERLREWGLGIDARHEYSRMMDTDEICHGIISSLAVLYVLDLMYQKYNPTREHADVHAVHDYLSWNQDYFERDIVSACSAIFVHNLPKRCFANAKIKRSQAPVAFLLKLSDCLQDWERPSLEDPVGIPAAHFGIETTNGGLVFYADVQNERKYKIEDEVLSCLDAPDIWIV